MATTNSTNNSTENLTIGGTQQISGNSTDGTFTGVDNTTVSTSLAIKTYVDTTAGGDTLVPLATITASNQSTVDFDNHFTSDYEQYLITFNDVIPVSDSVIFQALMGTGAGPTYLTTGYQWTNFVAVAAGGYQSFSNTSDTQIDLTPDSTYLLSNVVAEGGCSGQIWINGTDTTSKVVTANGELSFTGATGTQFIRCMNGFQRSADTYTGIRFQMSAGNVSSGVFRLYGLSKTGGGSGGGPGGSNGEIQYNASGAFGGDSGFTTDGAGALTVTGSIAVDNLTIDGNKISSTAGDIDLDPTGSQTVKINSGNGVDEISTDGTFAAATDLQLPTALAVKTYVDAQSGGGGGSGGYTLIQSQTASASATIEFTDLSSTYSQYMLVFENIVPSAATPELYLRTSTDNGSTFDSGASDYMFNCEVRTLAGSGTRSSSGASDHISLTSNTAGVGMTTTAAYAMNGYLVLTDPSSAVGNTAISFQNTYQFSASDGAASEGGGLRKQSAAVDAIQLLFSSGNITSGDFKLYGLPAAAGAGVMTDWVAYTPTTQGFGTISSVKMFSRRVGNNLEITGSFVMGSSTAVEARVNLGYNGGDGNVVVDSSVFDEIQITGICSVGGSFAGQLLTMGEPSAAYLTLMYNSSSGYTKVNGSTIATGQKIGFQASFPIASFP